MLSAEAGIETAAALLAEAEAKVEKAKADKKAAEAQVQVAAANLQMAKVFVQYTRIESPYDGVVIYRGEAVHPGSFVRAADEGGKRAAADRCHGDEDADDRAGSRSRCPLLQCRRSRDRHTRCLAGSGLPRQGQPRLRIGNLNDRTMRAEIDLDNPDGVLRDGMFGRADHPA